MASRLKVTGYITISDLVIKDGELYVSDTLLEELKAVDLGDVEVEVVP